MSAALALFGTLELLLLAGPAEPAVSPREVVGKAVEAHGGEANLRKYKAASSAGAGTFFGLEQALPYRGTWVAEGKDKYRMKLDMVLQGEDYSLVTVVNGDRGWNRFKNEPPVEMRKDELAEEHERLYAEWLTRLEFLGDKAYTLAAVEGAPVEGRATVGVRVSRPGRRDVDLYFDRDKGLLLKMVASVKEVGEREPQKLETIYGGYTEVQGVQQPTRMRVIRGGELYFTADITEVRLLEKADPNLFEQP